MINYKTHGGNASGHILRTGFGISLLAILLLAGLVSLVNAQGAMEPEAKVIVLSEDSNITVTFEGSNAAFNNSFGLWSPRYQELFWGHSTSPNTTFDLGYFPSYTELIFFINNSQNTFLSGPGNRNPDGAVHAAITEIDSQTWRVGFEDTLGGGDHDYNDITVLVKGGLYVIPPNPQKPDFLVLPEDITFSKNNPTEGDIVEIQAKVHNLGNSTDSNVSLGFYDGDPDNGGQLISTTTINGIGKEENVTKTIQWDTTGKAGTHNIYVKVDPENLIDEAREDNNKANKEIIISKTPTAPTVHITANPPTHDINVSTNFTFTANPLGSWGNNISYSWSDTYEKCVTADFVLTGQTISRYLDVACGNATISVVAEDEIGNVANDTYLVTVHENVTPIPTPVSAFNISGFKINNATGSGVSNWNITLMNSTMQKSMLTGADGSYKFMNLVNGTYNVTEETKTGWTSVSPISQQVTINGADIMNVNFTNQPVTTVKLGSISGYKIDVATVMGLPDWNIQLIGIVGAGAETRVIREETTTDASGFYKFDNLLAGRYILTETFKGGYVPVGSFVKNIQLASGENSKNNNFTNLNLLEKIVPTGEISGTVFDDFNYDSEKNSDNSDKGEPGLAGWTIELLLGGTIDRAGVYSGGTLIKTTTTDKSGNYVFKNLPEGNYVVRVKIIKTGWVQTAPKPCLFCPWTGLNTVKIPNDGLRITDKNFGFNLNAEEQKKKKLPNTFYAGINWKSDAIDVPQQAYAFDASLRKSYADTDTWQYKILNSPGPLLVPPPCCGAGGMYDVYVAYKNIPTEKNYLANPEGNGNYRIAFGHSGGTQTLMKKLESGAVTAEYAVFIAPALISPKQVDNLIKSGKVKKKVIIVESTQDALYQLQAEFKIFTGPDLSGPTVSFLKLPLDGGLKNIVGDAVASLVVFDVSRFINDNNIDLTKLPGDEIFWAGGADREKQMPFKEVFKKSANVIVLDDKDFGNDFAKMNSFEVHHGLLVKTIERFLNGDYPFDGSVDSGLRDTR